MIDNNPNHGYTIALASDHAGLELKNQLVARLADRGHEVLDLGPEDNTSVDYPDYARKVCMAIHAGEAERGILVCGSGIGMSIAANRYVGIRCALVHDETTARLGRQHNDSNAIALGARLIDTETAWSCVLAWLTTAWEGGRHAQRIAKIDAE